MIRYKRVKCIPYPPLANEAFFRELNDTLELAIDDIEVVHQGGKIFSDHIKLVMAKLHIGDFNAMSGEQAKIGSQEIRDNIQNAVECGACVLSSNVDTTAYGVTMTVDEDQNLLLLDGNQLITIDIKTEVITDIKNYNDVITEFKSNENIEQTLFEIVQSISDAGLIGKVETLSFLYEQFIIKIKRTSKMYAQIQTFNKQNMLLLILDFYTYALFYDFSDPYGTFGDENHGI